MGSCQVRLWTLVNPACRRHCPLKLPVGEIVELKIKLQTTLATNSAVVRNHNVFRHGLSFRNHCMMYPTTTAKVAAVRVSSCKLWTEGRGLHSCALDAPIAAARGFQRTRRTISFVVSARQPQFRQLRPVPFRSMSASAHYGGASG
jgi:hypothetical protein